MPRFHIRHNEPIWETTEFDVDLPEALSDGYESYEAYVADHIEDLLGDAVSEGRAIIAPGDRVTTMDSDIEVRPADYA